MKKIRIFPITLSLVLLLVALPSLQFPIAHGATYTPGVAIGEYVDYGQISFQSSGSAFNLGAFNHTIDLRDTVTNVVGNTVTISEKASFDNGTAPHIGILQGDVATGTGNLTFALIAGGLSAGDPVNQSPVSGFTGFPSSINATVVRSYAGALRSVNVGIQQPSLPGVTFRSAVYWDSQTGFGLEISLTSFIPAGLTSPSSPASSVTFRLKATTTNIWSPSSTSDFGLDITSLSPFVLYQGSADRFSVNLTSVGGFAGTVSLQAQLSHANSTVTNPPTVSLSSSSVTLGSGQSGQSSLQVTSTSTLTNLGIYLITVNATSSSLKHDAVFVLEVVPPDFELSPDTIFVTVPTGTTVSTTLIVRPLGAFSGPALLSSFVIQPGLQISLNTTSVVLSPGKSVNVQVNATAASTVVASTYFGYVMANSATQSHTSYIIINVIQLAPPTIVIISVLPSVAKTGDSVNVTFGVSSLTTVTNVSINWGDGTLTQTLATTASTDTHIYTSTGNGKSEVFKITINATNTIGTGTATYMETINDRLPTASITGISPTTVYIGQTLTLSFSASDPDGTIASANVDWGDGTNNALTGTATQATHSYSTAGTYTIKVTTTDNSGNFASSSTSLTIPQPDINLASTSPSPTTIGHPTTSAITVSPVNGFTSVVYLSVNAPSGITCTVDHATLQGSGTATLSCTSSTVGDYSVIVTATGGVSPHTTTQSFHITAQVSDITITSTAPASANIGVSSTSTITISPTYGFTGTVTLAVSAPTGITCSIDHATIQGSGTATLTCTSNTPNDYVVSVTATGGAAPHTTTQTFHVSAAPSQAAPAPTILGLPPVAFYGVIGVLIAAVIGGIAVLIRRRNP